MKVAFFWLMLVATLAFLLSGCEVYKDSQGEIYKGEMIGGSFDNRVFRLYDHEEGVVCYSSTRGLSCLRMVKTP